MKTHNPIENLIFDITGVLFTFNYRKILSLLGSKDLAAYLIKHWRNPINRSLEISAYIAQREDDGTLPIIFYRDNPQPPHITACLLGSMSNNEAARILKEKISQLYEEGFLTCNLEVTIMQRIIDVMLDPQTKLATFTPNKSLVRLIEQLKQQNGNRCYIISNLDSQTYEILEKQYPEIFALFNDAIISAHVGLIKPYPAIYEHLLEKEKLAPRTCLFVDDQQENIASAELVGITGVLYTNMRALKKQLAKLKVLT